MARVTETLAASASEAAAHSRRLLSLQTDCGDGHAGLEGGHPDFVLLDVRDAAASARWHVPGASSLRHREISAERVAAWPRGALFVVTARARIATVPIRRLQRSPNLAIP